MSDLSGTKFDFDQDTLPEPMPVPGNFSGEDIEVDPDEALTEAHQEGVDPSPEQPQEPEAKQEEQEDVVDILVPKAEPKQWRIGPSGAEIELIQKPLSFIQKMQWFSLVGRVLDKAMSGPDGISVNDILSDSNARSGQLSMEDFRDADTFVRALGRLMIHAPDFLLESYAIWLGASEFERPRVIIYMAAPEDQGGLSDDMGLEMIEVFIDQNFDALADFFGGKLGGLQKRVLARQKDRKDRLGLK